MNAVSGAVTYLTLTGTYKLAASDAIKIVGYQSSGSTINITANTNSFSVVKIF